MAFRSHLLWISGRSTTFTVMCVLWLVHATQITKVYIKKTGQSSQLLYQSSLNCFFGQKYELGSAKCKFKVTSRTYTVFFLQFEKNLLCKVTVLDYATPYLAIFVFWKLKPTIHFIYVSSEYILKQLRLLCFSHLLVLSFDVNVAHKH